MTAPCYEQQQSRCGSTAGAAVSRASVEVGDEGRETRSDTKPDEADVAFLIPSQHLSLSVFASLFVSASLLYISHHHRRHLSRSPALTLPSDCFASPAVFVLLGSLSETAAPAAGGTCIGSTAADGVAVAAFPLQDSEITVSLLRVCTTYGARQCVPDSCFVSSSSSFSASSLAVVSREEGGTRDPFLSSRET